MILTQALLLFYLLFPLRFLPLGSPLDLPVQLPCSPDRKRPAHLLGWVLYCLFLLPKNNFIPMGLYSNQSPADSLTFTKAHSFPVVCYAGRSMDSSSGLIIVLKSVVGKKKMAFWRWRMIMMVQHWTGCWETIGKFFINDKWIISSWEHFKWNSKHLHYNKDDLEWLYKE